MRKTAPISIPTTLREALGMMVLGSGVSVEDQVRAMRADGWPISKSYLYNSVNGNLDEEGYHYQLRGLLPNIRCTRNPIVVDWHCRELNSVRVPILPQPLTDVSQPAAVDVWRADVCAAMKELGEMAGAIERSLSDQDMSAEDAKACWKEAWDLIERAAILAHRARQVWEADRLQLALPAAG